MKNIAFIGFMATGKTSTGAALARALSWNFIDTDKFIEQKMGMSVADIFSRYGEKRFRAEEKQAISEIAGLPFHVISTGGGAVLDRENVLKLKDTSVLVCLTASPEVIYERIRRDGSRPLLASKNPYERIVELLKARESYYDCADLYIDTSEITIEKTVEIVVSELRAKKALDRGTSNFLVCPRESAFNE